MHFRRFKSKKDLKQAISDGLLKDKDAREYFEETSFHGPEYRSTGKFAVCMDHPKRSKFAVISVKDDRIVGVS